MFYSEEQFQQVNAIFSLKALGLSVISLKGWVLLELLGCLT